MTVQEYRRQIGDYTYSVKIFGAVQGKQVFGKIIEIAGPALSSGDFLKDGVRFLSLVDDFAPRSAIIQTVTAGPATREELLPLDKIFDQHFADRYDELLEWLLFAIEVNFARSLQRFLGRLPAIAMNVRKTLGLPELPETSPKASMSIGGSGVLS